MGGGRRRWPNVVRTQNRMGSILEIFIVFGLVKRPGSHNNLNMNPWNRYATKPTLKTIGEFSDVDAISKFHFHFKVCSFVFEKNHLTIMLVLHFSTHRILALYFCDHKGKICICTDSQTADFACYLNRTGNQLYNWEHDSTKFYNTH